VTSPARPAPTGAQTIQLQCWAADGTSLTATLSYNADTGAPTGLTVVNTSSRSTRMVLTVSGVESTVTVAAGTRSYTANQMRTGWGLTNVNTQLSGFSAVSP
jgi:hypothetical protein